MINACDTSKGFSTVELVTVLVIIGILAASSTVFLTPSSSIQLQATRDQIVTAISTAQQRAMSRNLPVRVTTSGNQIDIQDDGDGDGDFSPSNSVFVGGIQYPLTFAANQSLNTSSFVFNRLGETLGGTITLSQSGASVTIEVTDSGYAY